MSLPGGPFTSQLRLSFNLQILFPFFLSLLRARWWSFQGFILKSWKIWVFFYCDQNMDLYPFKSFYLPFDFWFCFASFCLCCCKKSLLVTCSSVNDRLRLNSGHSHFPRLPWWAFRAVHLLSSVESSVFKKSVYLLELWPELMWRLYLWLYCGCALFYSTSGYHPFYPVWAQLLFVHVVAKGRKEVWYR